ncbi:MAG: 2-dehydropantoate 2-reductase [bacterium]|nr:2-dehydropantoate 2-reductase [bacterium]
MPSIAILGAGSIGCYVGGRLAAAGCSVVLIGRPRIGAIITAQGLDLSDYHGWTTHLAPADIRFSTAASAAAEADLVLVTVKSADTAAAAQDLQPHLKRSAIVISLQNGLHNAEHLQHLLPRQTVLTGMVPFNVVQQTAGHFHQGSEGGLALEDSPLIQAFVPAFEAAGLPLELHADIKPVQWAKLLFNLNNAINALSGLPLKSELSQRAYRRVLAAAQREGLALLQARQQKLARLSPLSAHWVPALLEVPDAVFRIAANKMLAIDPLARSSMQDDLIAGRQTEIDYLQGEIISLAKAAGTSAPVNEKLAELIHIAETGDHRHWTGAALLAATGLR